MKIVKPSDPKSIDNEVYFESQGKKFLGQVGEIFDIRVVADTNQLNYFVIFDNREIGIFYPDELAYVTN